MKCVVLFLSALLSLTSAHFTIKYPPSRGDTEGTAFQYPCGGLDASTTDRTAWPLSGGSLALTAHDTWAYTFVNLGIGSGINASTEFSINLVHGFNQTGAGMFCLPKITIPKGVNVQEGMNASVQVVEVTEKGDALYNCADITFKSDAVLLQGSDCINSTGVGGTPLTAGNPSGKGGSMVNSAEATFAPKKSAALMLAMAAFAFRAFAAVV